MANFCESCGAKVGAGEKFCPECGEPLSVREEKPAPKPVVHSAEARQAMDAVPKRQEGNRNSLLYVLGAVVIAAAIGGGFYFMNQHPSVGGNSSVKSGKINSNGNEKATAVKNHEQGNSPATQQMPGAEVGNSNPGSAGQNVSTVSGSSIAGASHSPPCWPLTAIPKPAGQKGLKGMVSGKALLLILTVHIASTV